LTSIWAQCRFFPVFGCSSKFPKKVEKIEKKKVKKRVFLAEKNLVWKFCKTPYGKKCLFFKKHTSDQA
jgi:hypothetical protein